MMTMMVVVMEMMTLLVAKLGKLGPPPVGNNTTIPLCDSQHSWSTLNRCEPRSKCSIKIKMISLMTAVHPRCLAISAFTKPLPQWFC